MSEVEAVKQLKPKQPVILVPMDQKMFDAITAIKWKEKKSKAAIVREAIKDFLSSHAQNEVDLRVQE